MIGWLKRLFADPGGFKVRVLPFDREINYYSIEFKRAGSWKWNELEKAMLYDSEWLCTMHQPILYSSFERACEFARSLTEDKIDDHISTQTKRYNDHIKKLRQHIKERNKTFTT